jgi:hypothetical protein
VDITEFIAARLDEDEAAAVNSQNILSGRWHIDADGNVQDENTAGSGNAYIACGPYGGGIDDADAAHIARHDPARVLREVAAKRAILALHDLPQHYCPLPVVPGRHGQLWTPEEGPCWTLRHLAATWSDHPDYRAGWKP